MAHPNPGNVFLGGGHGWVTFGTGGPGAQKNKNPPPFPPDVPKPAKKKQKK